MSLAWITPEKIRGENNARRRKNEPDQATRNAGQTATEGLMVSLATQPTHIISDRIRFEVVMRKPHRLLPDETNNVGQLLPQ